MSPRRMVSGPPCSAESNARRRLGRDQPRGHATALECDEILEKVGRHFAVGVKDVQEHLFGGGVESFRERARYRSPHLPRCGSSGRLVGRRAAHGWRRPPEQARAGIASRPRLAYRMLPERRPQALESEPIRWRCAAEPPCGSRECPTGTPFRSRRRPAAGRSTRCARSWWTISACTAGVARR